MKKKVCRLMSQIASRPVVSVKIQKKFISWLGSKLLLSMSLHMCNAFCFCSAAFSIFALFQKTADPKNSNSFKSKGMAFTMTLLPKKFNWMLILFYP